MSIRLKMVAIFLLLAASFLFLVLFQYKSSKKLFIFGNRAKISNQELQAVNKLRETVDEFLLQVSIAYSMDGKELPDPKPIADALENLKKTIELEIQFLESEGEKEEKKSEEAFDLEVTLPKLSELANRIISDTDKALQIFQDGKYWMFNEKFSIVLNQVYKKQFLSTIQITIDDAMEEASEANQEFYEIAETQKIISYVVSFLAVTIALSALFILFTAMGRSITELTKGARRVAEGNLTEPVAMKGQDEFTELSVTFNRMMYNLNLAQEKLIKANQELEERVTERTEELAETNEELVYQMAEMNRTTLLLQETKAFMDTAIEQSPAGVMIADTPDSLQIINPAALEILGFSSKVELSAEKRAGISFHKDGTPFKQEQLPLVRSLKQGEVVQNVEVHLQRQDGTRRMVLAFSAPIRNADGKIIAAILLFSDITRLTEMEKERQSLQTHLLHAQKMEAIVKLAGGIAHDFNNIMTGINGFAEFIIDSMSESDPHLSDVEDILKAGKRAAHLTQQLLAFSRQQVIAPHKLDLNKTISENLEQHQKTLRQGVELKFEPGDLLWSIHADPLQVFQALEHLVANSAEAMPDGGVITFGTANHHQEKEIEGLSQGEYVCLYVKDNGKGMTPDVLHHATEPFFSTKTKDQAPGLGLSTVYGIVKQNQGEITIESELGKGTTVRLYFPRAKETSTNSESEERSVSENTTAIILLVEDEQMVRRLAKKALSKQGYTVVEAKSGPDALEIVKNDEGQIDLLLTDMIMPQMSGRELYDHLKKAIPGLNVIFMSGYSEDHISNLGSDLGGMAFLQKPFTLDGLTNKVAETLN